MVKFATDYLDGTAQRFPDKMAFIDANRGLTFGQLRQEAQRVAGVLARRGWFKQPIVLFFEKSVECIAASQGVVYSGNFYSPLDTKMPRKRIDRILAVLDPAAFLTDRAHAVQAAGVAGNCPVLIYEDLLETALETEALAAAMARRIDTDVVSVLFTSGSTGTPKGVIAPHRFLLNYTEWAAEAFGFDETQVRGNQAPLYFAIAAYIDVYSILKSGGTMYLLAPQQFMFPRKLMANLAEKHIDTILWVPSLLRTIADLGGLEAGPLPRLRRVFFCGEPMPVRALHLWRQAFSETMFVNLYGSTELTMAAYYRVERDFADTEALPIGHPCPYSDVLLLADGQRPAMSGEVGEICVRGSSIAAGYYHDTERTAASFVQNPLNPHYPELIFRTGDLARYNEQGELVYVSRKDSQIKHMGYRIELGEVETGIASIDGIQAHCCMYDKEHAEIVLFYTGPVDEKTVMRAAAELLPRYMWPGRLVRLESLPRTLSGKVDRMELLAGLNG